jgi:hypothetical protein
MENLVVSDSFPKITKVVRSRQQAKPGIFEILWKATEPPFISWMLKSHHGSRLESGPWQWKPRSRCAAKPECPAKNFRAERRHSRETAEIERFCHLDDRE